jgi:hypothetical protein
VGGAIVADGCMGKKSGAVEFAVDRLAVITA